MNLWHRPLTPNELRQCLRIAFGCTLGFVLCKIFGWSNGVFFTVTPVLLLGLVPVMNGHAARQLIASAAMCGLEVSARARSRVPRESRQPIQSSSPVSDAKKLPVKTR